MLKSKLFLEDIVETLNNKDKLHSKKLRSNVLFLTEKFPIEFDELLTLIHNYFTNIQMSTDQIVIDYLKMINDMRIEGLYFIKNGKYRCDSQEEANKEVYSDHLVMSYYMNALLVSQILWKHHFQIFMYFKKNLQSFSLNKAGMKILDIGPGHGFFSHIVKNEFPDYQKIDIVDISETSLNMTKSIIGNDNGKINYFKKDIFDYNDNEKYDLIVLGEVIEHLDNPKQILKKLRSLLSENGLLWITAPTNAPALDHVYLFRTKEEIFDLIKDSDLNINKYCSFFAEDVPEELALKFKITNLVGMFCNK